MSYSIQMTGHKMFEDSDSAKAFEEEVLKLTEEFAKKLAAASDNFSGSFGGGRIGTHMLKA